MIGDHVDRAERDRVGGELVARAGRVGLVRHGDGEPGEAQRERAAHRVAPAAARHRERGVDPVEPGLAVRGVEDGGRPRVRDGITDEAGDPGLAVDRHSSSLPSHSPLTPWARMFASCSARVVAK